MRKDAYIRSVGLTGTYYSISLRGITFTTGRSHKTTNDTRSNIENTLKHGSASPNKQRGNLQIAGIGHFHIVGATLE